MTTEGLKSLDEIWESMDDGDGLSDEPAEVLDVDEVEEATEDAPDAPQVDEGQEQSDEEFIPAKLSDLYAQDDEDGQGETAPNLLAQEITLPNGETVPIQELIHRQEEMRKDYTQKTQTLAEERKSFESEREQLQAVADLRELLTSDPVNTVAQMAVQLGLIDEQDARYAANKRFDGDPNSLIPQGKKEDKSQEDIDAIVEAKAQEKLEELLNSNPAIKQIQSQQAVSEVNQIFNQIEEVHGLELDGDDRKAVLQASLDWEEDNLEYVVLRLNAALQQRQAGKERAKNGQGLKSVRGSQPNDSDIVTTPPSSFEEAWGRIEKKLAV